MQACMVGFGHLVRIAGPGSEQRTHAPPGIWPKPARKASLRA
jgi:hypothetical protein